MEVQTSPFFDGNAAFRLEDRLENRLKYRLEPEIFQPLRLGYLDDLINNTGRSFREERSRLDYRVEELHTYAEMLDPSEEISQDDFQKLAQLKEDLAQKHCSYYWNTKYEQGKLDQNKVKDTLRMFNNYLTQHAERLGFEYLDNFVPEPQDQRGVRTDYLKAKFQHRLRLLKNNSKLAHYQELSKMVFDERGDVNQRLEKISYFFNQLGKLSNQELEMTSILQQKMKQKWDSKPNAHYVLDKIKEESLYNQASNKLKHLVPFSAEPEDIKEVVQSVQAAQTEASDYLTMKQEICGQAGDPSAALHTTIYAKIKENPFVKNLKERLSIPLGSVCTKFVELINKTSSPHLNLNYV